MSNFVDRLSGQQLTGIAGGLLAFVRPIALTMTIAIPAAGSFSVGLVALFSRTRAMDMADASVRFLQGIPDAAWTMIGAVAIGYFGAKTFEVTKAPPLPGGRVSPEDGGGAVLPKEDPDGSR